MKLTRRVVDGRMVLHFGGVLRASPSSIASFNETLTAVATPLRGVDLDLGDVLFVDSLWLGFLVSLTLKCKDNRVTMRVTRVSRQLWRVIEQSHIDQVLPQPVEIETRKPAQSHSSRHAVGAS